MEIKDEYGLVIKSGDTISFSYGIPPVKVIAPIVEIDGELVAITDGHNPAKEQLSFIKKYFNVYKEQK